MSKVNRFMEWWEDTHVFIGFLTLLILALPLGIISIIVELQERKKGTPNE